MLRAAMGSAGEFRIMLVEDSASVRASLRSIFDDIAAARVVGEADSAVGAIAALPSLRPDLVTLDLRLRDGSGLDVLDHLHAFHPQVQVIVFSERETLRARCCAAGALHFFSKTHETKLFFETVSAMARHTLAQRAAGNAAGN